MVGILLRKRYKMVFLTIFGLDLNTFGTWWWVLFILSVWACAMPCSVTILANISNLL